MDPEDVSPRVQGIGRIEAIVYLVRILETVPYGHSSRLRRVVSGSNGLKCSRPKINLHEGV